MQTHAVVTVSRAGKGKKTFKNGKNAALERSVHIICNMHRQYLGVAKPRRNCGSCLLLFILKNQHGPHADRLLGSLNPYAYLLGSVDLEDACSGLKIRPY